MTPLLKLLLCLLACIASACPAEQKSRETHRADAAASASAGNGFYGAFGKTLPVAELTSLGRRLFFDPALSASGAMACASCHDPAHAFGPPNSLPVQPGGRELRLMGIRAAPALRYLQSVPPFTEHSYADEADDGGNPGPAGGHTWDGRAQSAHDQARIPLLSAFEMGNATVEEVVAKTANASYAAQFRQAFGEDIFDKPQLAFNAVLLALEVFQQNPGDFYPYDSKYDAYLRGQVELTPQERRGLDLFNDRDKGNCASCHPSNIRSGAFPQFSDFGLVALGVPRNDAIAANADPNYYDLGLCGPLRTDFLQRKDYCGLFRTPSLRNVALRRTFFHNGVFHSLDAVLHFYVQRDTDPGKWYRRDATGRIRKFDDLPLQYHGNVNTDPPFDRKPGDRPALAEAEIQDVIAFLQTLNDGYQGLRATGDRLKNPSH